VTGRGNGPLLAALTALTAALLPWAAGQIAAETATSMPALLTGLLPTHATPSPTPRVEPWRWQLSFGSVLDPQGRLDVDVGGRFVLDLNAPTLLRLQSELERIEAQLGQLHRDRLRLDREIEALYRWCDLAHLRWVHLLYARLTQIVEDGGERAVWRARRQRAQAMLRAQRATLARLSPQPPDPPETLCDLPSAVGVTGAPGGDRHPEAVERRLEAERDALLERRFGAHAASELVFDLRTSGGSDGWRTAVSVGLSLPLGDAPGAPTLDLSGSERGVELALTLSSPPANLGGVPPAPADPGSGLAELAAELLAAELELETVRAVAELRWQRLARQLGGAVPCEPQRCLQEVVRLGDPALLAGPALDALAADFDLQLAYLERLQLLGVPPSVLLRSTDP
jgi:hypothetical protein